MVLQTFNPSNQEVEAGGTLSSKPALSTEQIPGQPRATGRNPLSENQIKSNQIKSINQTIITSIYQSFPLQWSIFSGERLSSCYPGNKWRYPLRCPVVSWSYELDAKGKIHCLPDVHVHHGSLTPTGQRIWACRPCLVSQASHRQTSVNSRTWVTYSGDKTFLVKPEDQDPDI